VTDPPKPSLDAEGLDHLLTWAQSGVVSRRQILELHGTDSDIARMLRRRELVTIHPGTYVNHTGKPTWEQRAWAAVLYYWPAALTRESALPTPTRSGPVHVAVAAERTVRRVAGVTTHRTAGFDDRVQWIKSPPRVSYEHAAIDVAADKPDLAAAFQVFADACQTRETTAAAIAETLRNRRRVRGRAVLLELLADLDAGACSVLERGYLDLERRHGLPTLDRRQVPAMVAGKKAYRDVDHGDFGLLVELDGRAFHDNAAARDRDATRDLASAVTSGVSTVRLTYGQVFREGCATIAQIATLLERGGWPGPFVTCPGCPSPH
jgi:hypothetical protein